MMWRRCQCRACLRCPATVRCVAEYAPFPYAPDDVTDAALDEALQKRNFARALENASERAASAAAREAAQREQKAMDALARPMPDGLAS